MSVKELFVAVKDYQLEVDSMQRAINFCLYNQISPTNLILLVIRTYLSKVNGGQEDITIENFISRRSTHDEITSGGSRTLCYPCRTVISGDTTFIDAARLIQNHQNRIYMYSGYDPELIRAEMKKRYNTPDDTSYVSVYLTYQPPMNTNDLDPNAEKMPIYAYKGGFTPQNPDMPIRFYSGEDDPCALSRKKFVGSIRHLKKTGYTDVRGKLYKGMRHDILHERNKTRVYADILGFLKR